MQSQWNRKHQVGVRSTTQFSAEQKGAFRQIRGRYSQKGRSGRVTAIRLASSHPSSTSLTTSACWRTTPLTNKNGLSLFRDSPVHRISSSFGLVVPISCPVHFHQYTCPTPAVAQYHWFAPGFLPSSSKIRFNWLRRLFTQSHHFRWRIFQWNPNLSDLPSQSCHKSVVLSICSTRLTSIFSPCSVYGSQR